MSFQFKKSKYPIFRLAFWILIFCAIYTIFAIAKININVFENKDLSGYSKQITVNAKFNRIVNDDYFVCIDDFCKLVKNNSAFGMVTGYANIKSAKFNSEDDYFRQNHIKNIYFASPKEQKKLDKVLDNVVVFIDNEMYFYNVDEIKKSKKMEAPIFVENKNEKVNYEIYALKKGELYNNNKTMIKTAMLSLVNSWKFYIVPYFWFFIALLIFIFNKDVSNLKMKNKLIISIFVPLIIFLSLFLVNNSLEKRVIANGLVDFVLKDTENNINNSNTYVILDKKSKDTNEDKKLKEKHINVEYIDASIIKNRLTKIEKERFSSKNKRIVVYLDTRVAEVDLIAMNKTDTEIYETNYYKIAKIVFK